MLELWHIWVIAGLVLWIVEIFTPGFVAGVFGTACLIVAPFAGTDFTFKAQLLVFGIATAVMSLGIRPLVLKHFCRAEAKISTNVDALIGKAGLVTETIDHASGTGRVKIGGEVWRAITPDESRVDVGVKVAVRAVEGCKVVVEITSNTERKSS
jgi:membrane protein implicated in regulation of membrane protease activity